MSIINKLLITLKNNWKGYVPWIIGFLGLVVFLWLYLGVKLMDFGTFLVAIISFITLISIVVFSLIQVRILNYHTNKLGAIEHALNLKPVLVVNFATGESEVNLAANWSELKPAPSELGFAFMGKSKSPGHAPLRFMVLNRGTTSAQKPKIFIKLPQHCKVIERSIVQSIAKSETMFISDENNGIRIMIDSLARGLLHKTSYAWVVFPRPSETYELKYAVYANNLSEPNTGTLLVHIAEGNAEPSKVFPGDESEQQLG
jgi:hypothetical protein